jgi:hypothetical protein
MVFIGNTKPELDFSGGRFWSVTETLSSTDRPLSSPISSRNYILLSCLGAIEKCELMIPSVSDSSIYNRLVALRNPNRDGVVWC